MKTLRILASTLLATALIAGGGQIATADNNKAEAATLTFYKVNVCTYSWSGVGYGWQDTYSYTDYSWGEEFFLGKRDTRTWLRRDRATWLDGWCRTWRA
jgi:hypothetical protein